MPEAIGSDVLATIALLAPASCPPSLPGKVLITSKNGVRQQGCLQSKSSPGLRGVDQNGASHSPTSGLIARNGPKLATWTSTTSKRALPIGPQGPGTTTRMTRLPIPPTGWSSSSTRANWNSRGSCPRISSCDTRVSLTAGKSRHGARSSRREPSNRRLLSGNARHHAPTSPD
jgi:hypothetical protein